MESGGRFCAVTFVKNLASVALKMFSHFISFVITFYIFFTLNAIYNYKLHYCSTHRRIYSHQTSWVIQR
jgi:hypothetical protein